MTLAATFDVLYMLDSLRPAYREVHVSELHSLGYLSYILSLYDGNPVSNWGYSYVYHSLGGPFSEDVNTAVDTLRHTLHLHEASEGRLSLTEPGAIILARLKAFESHRRRAKYLAACCDAAMSRLLPSAIKAIQNEPMVAQAASVKKRHLLGEGPSCDELYQQVGALHKVLGTNASDVWLAGLLWLDYWNATASKETSST